MLVPILPVRYSKIGHLEAQRSASPVLRRHRLLGLIGELVVPAPRQISCMCLPR